MQTIVRLIAAGLEQEIALLSTAAKDSHTLCLTNGTTLGDREEDGHNSVMALILKGGKESALPRCWSGACW